MESMGTNFPGSLNSIDFAAFFPWEIDGETHAFLIWWSIPQDGNLMEKAPILWKKYGN